MSGASTACCAGTGGSGATGRPLRVTGPDWAAGNGDGCSTALIDTEAEADRLT